jgi:hypothetical protein
MAGDAARHAPRHVAHDAPSVGSRSTVLQGAIAPARGLIGWEPAKGYTGGMSDVSKRVEEMQERLDKVQEEIDEARADADKVDPPRPKETFIETSGEPREGDDADKPPD